MNLNQSHKDLSAGKLSLLGEENEKARVSTDAFIDLTGNVTYRLMKNGLETQQKR